MSSSSPESKTLSVRVIGPDRVIYEGQAASIQYPGGDGLYGILPGHAPMITTVELGLLRIKDHHGNEEVIVLARGFVSISNNKIEFAVDAGEKAEEIDLDRAQAAAKRARERIGGTTSAEERDLVRAQYALLRALARMHAAELHSGKR